MTYPSPPCATTGRAFLIRNATLRPVSASSTRTRPVDLAGKRTRAVAGPVTLGNRAFNPSAPVSNRSAIPGSAGEPGRARRAETTCSASPPPAHESASQLRITARPVNTLPRFIVFPLASTPFRSTQTGEGAHERAVAASLPQGRGTYAGHTAFFRHSTRRQPRCRLSSREQSRNAYLELARDETRQGDQIIARELHPLA